MGQWGNSLYQDDVAEDVRDYYKEQLRYGKSGNEITKSLIEHNEPMLSDSDDAPLFWFALADTQWDMGRLEDFVKEKALYYIRKKAMSQYEKIEGSRSIIQLETIRRLEEKLLSPQPPKKKISQHRLYHCPWKVGDVYSYPLESDYAKEKHLCGCFFLFQKIGETVCHPGHTIPIVWVKIAKRYELPTDETMYNKLEFVQTSAIKFDPFIEEFHIDSRGLTEQEFLHRVNEEMKKLNLDESGLLPVYRMALMNISRRVLPKSLAFLGNFQNTEAPKGEFVPSNSVSIPSFPWKSIEKLLIDRYCMYNLKSKTIKSEFIDL